MLAPTLGPAIGGFITDPLFVALVVHDQCCRRGSSSRCWLDGPSTSIVRIGAASALSIFSLCRCLPSFSAVYNWFLRKPRTRGWDSTEALLLAGICIVCGSGVIRRSLRHPVPLIDPLRLPRSQFSGRMLLQLRTRHRPLRGNFSVAGIPWFDPKLRGSGDRRNHDGDRCCSAGDGAGCHVPRTARRRPAADRRWLCFARGWPGRQRLYDLRDRFLGIVLAAACRGAP